MKKVLLSTTVLASLVAAPAFAAAPTVSVGGFLDFQAGISDQDIETGFPASREFKFANDTEIHISAEGRSDNGLIYGAVAELEADVTPDFPGEGLNADKTYLYLEGNFGRVEMGNNTDAAAALKVDASTLARATGGIDGDFYYYTTFPAGGGNGPFSFIFSPDLPTAFVTVGVEDSPKITYYSPRFSGVQVGVSYTPDQGNAGTAAGFTTSTTGDYEHVVNLGINYTAQYNNIGIAASATGEFADNELATVDDLAAYALGLNVSFNGFTLGGSWADWGESTRPAGGTVETGFWTLGASYVQGPVGVSLTYLEADSEVTGGPDDETRNVSLGADYQLAPGLVPYAEVSFFEYDVGSPAATDNDGTIFLVGTELSF